MCHSTRIGETFGNTIAEAMIHGVPVISHWGGNWPQAQKEVIGKSDYICGQTTSEYSNLMKTLYDDKEQYNEYSKYVKHRADTLFDYRVAVLEYIKLYKDILQ